MIAKHDYKILDDKVIGAYSLGQIVLPLSNNLAVGIPEGWELQFSENPIFGPIFFTAS
jgi:hypothetical protein